jgi:hypothetical protein
VTALGRSGERESEIVGGRLFSEQSEHERLIAKERRSVDAMRQILHEHVIETCIAGRIVEGIPRTAASISDFATRPNSPSG